MLISFGVAFAESGVGPQKNITIWPKRRIFSVLSCTYRGISQELVPNRFPVSSTVACGTGEGANLGEKRGPASFSGSTVATNNFLAITLIQLDKFENCIA